MQIKLFSCRLYGEMTQHYLARFVRIAERVWQRIYTCSRCGNDIGVEMK